MKVMNSASAALVVLLCILLPVSDFNFHVTVFLVIAIGLFLSIQWYVLMERMEGWWGRFVYEYERAVMMSAVEKEGEIDVPVKKEE